MKKFKTFLFIVLFSFSSLLYAAQVNINTADAGTLSSELSGVGQSKAEAIIAYREKYGPFKNVDDLAKVKGIGQATVDRNRENIITQ